MTRGPAECGRRSARFCREEAVSESKEGRLASLPSAERTEPVGEGFRSLRRPTLLLLALRAALMPLPSTRPLGCGAGAGGCCCLWPSGRPGPAEEACNPR